MSVVGNYLKQVRDEKRLSLKAVKSETGISDSVLSHIESGKNESPSAELLKKLAAIYNISLVDLFMKAGYLNSNDMDTYQQCFSGASGLTDDERAAVQNIIDVIVNKTERCPR